VRLPFDHNYDLLDFHLEFVAWGAKKAAATRSVFQSMADLSLSGEDFELGSGFASKKLLKPSSAGLTDGNHLRTRDVRLQRLGATIHCLSHDENNNVLLLLLSFNFDN
jgi:hypothetical protein